MVAQENGRSGVERRERFSDSWQGWGRSGKEGGLCGRWISGDDADDEDFVSPLGIYLKDKIGFLSDINITGTLECVLLL